MPFQKMGFQEDDPLNKLRYPHMALEILKNISGQTLPSEVRLFVNICKIDTNKKARSVCLSAGV